MKTLRHLFCLFGAGLLWAQDAPQEPESAAADETPAVADETPAVQLSSGSLPPPASAGQREGSPGAAPAAPASEVEENSEEPGEHVPRAHSAARYESAWSKNPFMLKTVAVAQTTVSFAQDWALAGMYRSPSGKITVTLQNKQTSEYQRLSNEDTEGDLRLVEAKFNRNRNEASVIVAKGSQTAELKYDDALTSKPVTINNTLRTPTAAPGQPGAQPGVPVSATGGVGAPPRPGMPTPGTTRPVPGATGAPAVTPPSISRRRQLIPPPTVAPPPAQP